MQETPRMRLPGAIRRLDVAAIAAVVAAGVLLSPGAAAASSTGDAEPKYSIIGAESLRAADRRGHEVKAAKEPKLRSRVDSHLDKAARSGRLMDTREVHAATLPDPTLAGSEIQLVWDQGRVPHQIVVAEQGQGANRSRAFGSIFLDDTSTDAVVVGPSGSGYEAGIGKNMYMYRDGHIEQWFSTYNGLEDHYLWAKWQKWAEAGTDHWVYNRWGRFTRAAGNFPYTKEFTLRSRPWAGSDKIRILNDMSPVASATTCTDTMTFNLGYGYGGGNAAVAIPIHRCNEVYPVGSWGRKEIGIKFVGQYSGKVMYLDMAGDYGAKDRYVVPTWADYAWIEVVACVNVSCSTKAYSRKDSGW